MRTTPQINLDNPKKELTVATWVYRYSQTGGGSYVSILGEATQCSTPFIWIYGTKTATNLRIQYRNGVGCDSVSLCSNCFTNEEWMHLAIVVKYAENKVFFYKNGELISQPTLTNAQFPNVTRVKYIMSYATGSDTYFGRVDDYRIYQRALNSQEIQNLYINK